MNKHENAEIVVIGGGAVGTAVACYLARDGADVALVERGEYAWGSSRRCDGHAVTYDSAPGYFSQFCKIGQDMFPEISRELPCDIEFEPEGLGLLVDDERDMETVLANYEGKKNEGVDVTFWDRDELLRHEPHVSDKVIACLNSTATPSSPHAPVLPPRGAGPPKGAKAFNRTAVTGITVRNGAVQSVETSSGSIATKKWCWPPASGPPASATWWA
ncbi:MAG: NAD(P)/FAD-dependent oxidoreductase [Bilophila wadsworthia]